MQKATFVVALLGELVLLGCRLIWLIFDDIFPISSLSFQYFSITPADYSLSLGYYLQSLDKEPYSELLLLGLCRVEAISGFSGCLTNILMSMTFIHSFIFLPRQALRLIQEQLQVWDIYCSLAENVIFMVLWRWLRCFKCIWSFREKLSAVVPLLHIFKTFLWLVWLAS